MREQLLAWLDSEPCSSPFSVLWDWLPRWYWRCAQLFWLGICIAAIVQVVKHTQAWNYIIWVGDYWLAPVAIVMWGLWAVGWSVIALACVQILRHNL